MAHFKHLRRGRYQRVRRSKRFLAFLAAQATRLASSAASKTLVVIEVAAVAAAQVYTATVNPSNAQTLVIGSKTYTFQAVLTNVDGNIKIGADLQATLLNLARAINASGGTPGTDYATLNTIHPTVSAASDATTLTVTAKTAGAAGNQIATTGTAGTGTWAADHLQAGSDQTDGPSCTVTAHGWSTYDGPFRMTAATTMPTGVTSNDELYVFKVDDDTVKLAKSKEDIARGAFLTFDDDGTGALTMKRAATSEGIFGFLHDNSASTIVKATDIDNLR